MKERRLKPGGFSRSQRRRREYREAARRADGELRHYENPGEPSIVFSTERNESGEIFNETTEIRLGEIQEELRGRSADLAKRRGEIINSVLENPQSFPITKANLSFVERQFPRIVRFARTLKNKGRLHPGIEDILGL